MGSTTTSCLSPASSVGWEVWSGISERTRSANALHANAWVRGSLHWSCSYEPMSLVPMYFSSTKQAKVHVRARRVRGQCPRNTRVRLAQLHDPLTWNCPFCSVQVKPLSDLQTHIVQHLSDHRFTSVFSGSSSSDASSDASSTEVSSPDGFLDGSHSGREACRARPQVLQQGLQASSSTTATSAKQRPRGASHRGREALAAVSDQPSQSHRHPRDHCDSPRVSADSRAASHWPGVL